MASLQELSTPVSTETSTDKPTETPAPETTATVAETTATETETPAPAKAATETETEDASEDGPFRELLKSDFGYDPSKYTSDYEAVKGLVEASRAIGARNEDAEYGKQARQLLAGKEAEFKAWLASQGGEKQKPAAKPSDGDVASWEQYQLLAAQAASPNASESVKQKFADAQSTITQRVFELASHREQALEPVMEKVIEKVSALLDQRLGAQTEQSTIQQMVDKHREWLHVDGDTTKPLTPAGEEAFRVYQEELADGVKPARALEKAIRNTQKTQNNTIKPIRKPVVGGHRQPAVAAPAKEPPSLDLLFRSKAEGGQGKGLADFLTEEWKKKQTA